MSHATAEQAAPAAGPAIREPDLSGHLPALDGVRGSAILGVMLYHMTVFTPLTTVDRAFLTVIDWGGYGVDLFFVLSGFLITGILYDAKRDPHYFRNFYARRTLRIFPLYYAVVFFSLVILPHIPNPKAARFGTIAGDEVWYWTYLSNFCIAARGLWRHGILDVSWSLAIEEQFYLLWPAVVYACSGKTLRRICLGLIAAAIAFRTATVFAHANPIATIILTPSKLDALAVGALIAVTVRETGVLRWVGMARYVLWIAGAAFITIFMAGGWKWDGRLMLCVGYTALAACYGSLLLLAIAAAPSSPVARVFSSRLLRTFGRYSYAMYLFHLPLRAAIRDTAYGPGRFPTLFGSQLPGQLLFYPLAIAVTLGAAILSWHLYEKHFLKLKRYFPSSHTASNARPTETHGA